MVTNVLQQKKNILTKYKVEHLHHVRINKCHFIFDYNSHII